ncbi:Pycsar system effector family protein [Methanococcoides methylutens]|uniref:Pycsar effector protein domain-containing protein n=1 Tax=Methanococcoides methylutens MM1 TaxID=1434104 RepID=A0A0E3X271_METMT|nr:Pycsar system effector family protein [Methanococcoides methylutens]AKB85984.1 hypothetical protein MCMEM_1931 [Methanococcoides methylutens MM1]
MEKNLETIYSYVNNWLRFAEEKNAALIILNGGILFALISLKGMNLTIPSFISNNPLYYKLTIFYLLNFVLFSAFALLISLMSFLPQLNVIYNTDSGTIEDSDNLLFYSHIAKYKADIYLSKLHDLLETGNEYSKYELAYANQIITNSKIAMNKYEHFKVALWFTISSIFSPIMGYFLFYLLDSHNQKTKVSLLIVYAILSFIFYEVIY